MKIAGLMAGGTLALLLATLASSKAAHVVDRSVPLEVAGIDTLEVSGGDNSATIEINANAPAAASMSNDGASNLTVVRRGNTLAIRYKSPKYQGIRIVVPPSIRNFQLGATTEISNLERMQEVEIRTGESVTWKGKAAHLRVIGSVDAGDDSCAQGITIGEGAIGRLEIISPGARVSLETADQIEVAEVDAGPTGRLSVANATSLDHIHLKPQLATAGCAPAEPTRIKD